MFNELRHWLAHETGGASAGVPAELGAAPAYSTGAAANDGAPLDLRVPRGDADAERARIRELAALLARAVGRAGSEHFETATEGYIVTVERDWIDETTAESALSEG